MNNCRRRPSISRFSLDVCAVINRVRSAYGPRSMREAAAHVSIQRAESEIDRTLRQLLQAEADLSAWLRMLRQYETCWMELLAAKRCESRGRQAA